MYRALELRLLRSVENGVRFELLVPRSRQRFQGYSFGSIIAAQHPVLPAPMKTSHIFLSYPFDKRGLLTLFHSRTHADALTSLVQDQRSHILVIYGDHDEFTTAENYEAWSTSLKKDSDSSRLRVERIHGGTHFWRGADGDEVLEVTANWLDTP